MLGATVLQKHNLTKLIPLDREGWSFLSARPSTLQASQCSRSRCNTDRPADSASLSSHAPTGLPGYLPSRIHNETESKARIIPGGGCVSTQRLFSKLNKYRNGTVLLEERQVAAWSTYCNTWVRPTAQTGKLFRVSVCQQSSKSLLPVVQLAALHYVPPVLGHHWGDELQSGTN